MSKKPDGGPAFPVEPQGAWLPDCSDPDGAPMREFPGHPGMSLRDYAAIHALGRIPYDPQTPHAKQAAEAYRMADAMLEERDK